MTIHLEIEQTGQPLLRHRVPAFGATAIGRSPVSGLAIPEAPELAPEHLLVEPEGRGVRVLVLPGNAPAQLHGASFEEGRLAYGEPIVLGSLQLTFRRSSNHGPSPIILASLCVLGLCLVNLGAGQVDGGFALPMPAPPELLLEAETCATKRTSAATRGRELEERALASAERYPFAVGDGMEASRLFSAAACCYELGGDTLATERAQRAHLRWAKRMRERYLAHHLRLRVALDRGQVRVAVKQLPVLKALLRQQPEHAYVRWLAMAEAYLTGGNSQ